MMYYAVYDENGKLKQYGTGIPFEGAIEIAKEEYDKMIERSKNSISYRNRIIREKTTIEGVPDEYKDAVQIAVDMYNYLSNQERDISADEALAINAGAMAHD